MISVPISSKINTPFGDIIVHSVANVSMKNTVYMVSGDSVVKLEDVGSVEHCTESKYAFKNRIAALEIDKPIRSVYKHTDIEVFSKWIA